MGATVNEESMKAEIQAAYERLGFTQGWEFAKTPIAKLYTAETIIIGLNPGGTGDDKEWDYPQGNHFFLGEGGDRWPVIQNQVKILHDILELHQDDVFVAQFNPFRSSDYKSLGNSIKEDRSAEELKYKQQEATTFALQLWDWVISRSVARRFICMGSEVNWHISRKLGAMRDDLHYKTGWGEKLEIHRSVSTDGRVVVNWPHPSRYTIFTRDDPAMAELAKASMKAAARFN